MRKLAVLFKLHTVNVKEAKRKTMEMIRDLGGIYGKNLTFIHPNKGTVREDLTQVFSMLKFIAVTDPVRGKQLLKVDSKH